MGILVSLHLINMASPLPLPPQLRGFQIVNNNRFQDKSASRLCRGGGGGGGGGLGVFGNGQNGFLPLRLRCLLSRGEAAAAMEQGKQQQLEGGGFSDRKEARRAAKERKKQEEATRREQEWQAKLATHSEQQMDAIRRRIVEVSHMRREARKARKLKLEQAMKMGAPDVVIDLEFSHLMTTSQLSSLMQQVKFCYGANGKAATPCRLSVTSCRGIVADELDKIQGSQQWFINKEERCWLQVFERRKTDLVYLSADSPNLLTAVDPAGVYIVGGIVDRNHWKGATLMKAMNLSISHAKLPIGEHLKLTTSEVLTVNQVVEVLLRALELQDLPQAFLQAIPSRKREANLAVPAYHEEEGEEEN
ncbi:hypothetical protein CY35_01G156600 [Sphagnum magellanicum]|nr:hypothetical protein CY35_01G156600 [Sphagnum magellanicum]KAH9576344.1 hypothetical protein CY35_01G156600 [Sphagnum magellanicum]KAH9576345.1 hypothetical protein CY35_01G156600 [Sphagnum magellanicum]KAH9576346.1 hypothetical protein CY35_01G156600 [Sphagnum magellanicum]KAH9576347.1 hypothetical protein CY35_01G156600 [Sphagnum magellanicum]